MTERATVGQAALSGAARQLPRRGGAKKYAGAELLLLSKKVAENPVSIYAGGYGKPLGNRNGVDLAGLYKIKYRDLGIRVVYQLVVTGSVMKIVVISARTDEQVYREAAKRRAKYGF